MLYDVREVRARIVPLMTKDEIASIIVQQGRWVKLQELFGKPPIEPKDKSVFKWHQIYYYEKLMRLSKPALVVVFQEVM